MEVASWTCWTRQMTNFTFCHRSVINLPFPHDLQTLSPAVPSSTCLCHKVRAKPTVAGRHRFTRVGSMDRAGFTAPDLCQAHSVAAFLLPLILKALRCSSPLFWPSPVKAGLHSMAHITFLNGYPCLHQGRRRVSPAFPSHLKWAEAIKEAGCDWLLAVNFHSSSREWNYW